MLLLEERGHDEFVVRFQQTTGPVMAKGVEDTAFYRYLRLTALNEVGGDPGRFSLPVEDFHRANAARAARFPLHMLASQTHDTKRSGDVRARIGTLAAFAPEWRELVVGWREANQPLRARRRARCQRGVPDLPDPRRRMADRARAPRARTSRRRSAKPDATPTGTPDERWERSVIEFASGLYDHEPFRGSFDPFVAASREAGERAALGALLLSSPAPASATSTRATSCGP